MKIRRITQLLVVDAIEPALPTWRETLGFQVLAEVPKEGRLGFVLLARDDQHIMLQTKTSLAKDMSAVATKQPDSLLYIDVASLAAAEKAMSGTKVLVPRRTTFYGAHEIFYQTASGHIVGFAEHDSNG